MEGNSSGEELVAVKTRKPYTITKQREKWTEEEHNRFLEALKLYGRAWQRIEEHIGTKTAVQIRSHAQKFFTKLEKEALEKGIPPGQAYEIDIPPPRPKRKPNSPYPRKSSAGSLAPTEALNVKRLKSILHLGTNDGMDNDNGAHKEKFAPTEQLKNKEISEDPSHSEVLNVFQDDLSVSVPSVDKRFSNHRGKYMEFLPTKKKMVGKIAIDVSSAQHEVNQELHKVGKAFVGQETERVQQNYTKPHINLALENESSTPKLQDKTSIDYGKDVPTHSVKHVNIMGKNGAKRRPTEDSDGPNPVAVSGQVDCHANANGSDNPAASAIPVHNPSTIGSMHHLIPVFSPFAHLYTSQDSYRSFLDISTFSGLIISTLLQNPAVHAATSLAASFCPSGGLESSFKPSPEFLAEENSERNMNTTPSLEAIAAVTVAAAAAWWAAQGLLPWLPPGFAFAPPNTTMLPLEDTAHPQGHDGTTDNHLKEDQQVGQQNQSDDLKRQYHSSKSLSLSLSSSDSDDKRRDENSNENKTTKSTEFKPVEASGFADLDKARIKKKQDRSSCGSNTPSGSDVETDNIKKHDKENDEAKEVYFNNSPACGANRCRFRSSGSMNESWKEVSEEGRLAFEALFKRQVLPQSFSPPSSKEASTTMQNAEASSLSVDLNQNVCPNDPNHLQYDTHEEICVKSSGSIMHGKLDLHRSGFKPYKRCAVEAKENKTAETDETSNKRVHRLEDDAKSLC